MDHVSLSPKKTRPSLRVASLPEVRLNGDPLILRRLIFTESMPISTQATRVHSCDILMGPHGAGMVHALWMYPGSVVIEIMDPEHFPAGYYRNIAHLSGHIYFKHRKDELEQPEPTKTKIFEQILVTAAEIISNKAAFSRVVTLQKSCEVAWSCRGPSQFQHFRAIHDIMISEIAIARMGKTPF